MVPRLDPLQTTPPALELEVARQVLQDSFGMEASLSPLAGERDQTSRVDAGAGRRFVLKISNPADGRTILEMQSAALRHVELVDRGVPVMRALPAAAGAPWAEVPGPDGRVYLGRLFTFLPGQVTSPSALTTQAIWSFGQVTARLGRALRGFFHPAADYEIIVGRSHPPRRPPLLTRLADGPPPAQVERVLDRFQAPPPPALPRPPPQV